MKLAVVSPNPPWFPGGIERHVGELAKRMKDKVNLEIYCSTLNKNEVGFRKWNGIKTHAYAAFDPGYRYSRGLKQVLKNECEADLIHAHGFTTYAPKAALSAKKYKSFVFTPHFHPVGSTAFFRLSRIFYDPIVGSKLLKSANWIICVSKTEKKYLVQKFPEIKKKVVVIPSGVDIPKIQNAKPFQLEDPMILYIGRLEKYKNIDLIIRTMKKLPSDYQLYLIGGGPEEMDLKKLSKALKIFSRIHFLGHVDDKELHRWRKSCDLFITLSDIEAFGSTVIEAVAAGKPVIVNNRLSLIEFADSFPDAVRTIDIHKETIDKLAMMIKKTIEKTGNTQEYVYDVGEYDWPNVCKATYELYIK